MLPDLGRGGSPLRPAGNEISPSPVGGVCGSQADPLQPSPGGPGRPQTVGTDSTLLGPVRETFFFLVVHSMRLCFSLSLSRGSPRTRSCNNVRRSTSRWAPVLGLPNRPLGLSVLCFTLLLRVALDSVGTLIPAAGWHSAYSCQMPSSWSDVCDFVYHHSGQPQFFFKIGSCRFSVPVLFSAFRLWRLRPVSCSR